MEVRFFVDRMEDDVAVLMHADGTDFAEMPRSLLPKGTKEGTWLKASFTIDKEAAKNARKEVADLYDSLGDAP